MITCRNIKKLIILPQRFITFINQEHIDVRHDSEEQHDEIKYPGHIPTSTLQKAALMLGSGVLSFFQPWRQEMISTFGETSAPLVLDTLYKRMEEDLDGYAILRDRPRIRSSTVDFDALRKLPEGTLGRCYTQFLDSYGYSCDDRTDVAFIDSPVLAYVMQRYREVHDLTHLLLDQPTSMLGEVVVKWVEGIQTGLPMCVAGGLFGSLRLRPKQMQHFRKTHYAYALKVAHESRTIMFYYFEKNWEKPIYEVRAELRIPAAPSPTFTDKMIQKRHRSQSPNAETVS